jgi:hypothetical protein
MYPFDINSTWFWSSFIFSGLFLQVGILGITEIDIRSIWCSIPFIGGNQLGILLENTSLNSYNKEIQILGTHESSLLFLNYVSLYKSKIIGI